RERLARIMATPEMQALVRQAAQDASHGLLAGASDEQGRALVANLVDATADALAREARERLVPAAMAALRQELARPWTPEQRAALEGALNEAMSQATRTTIRTAAAQIPTSLGPAFASTLDKADVRGAVDRTVSDATRSALVASADVLRQIRSEREGPTLIQRLTRFLVASLAAAFVLGAAAVALSVWAVNVARRAKRTEVLTQSVLDNAAKAAEGKPWSEEMLALLAREMGSKQLRELRSLLKH
ncbi:MAG TPA: hypothetical protein VE987_22540, partial [Polyangiaceae bacterium]|nr:hypothetical protein [Polyangiaceae bacterium]